MFGYDKLIALILIGIAALYLWRSGQFKGRARLLAKTHLANLDLQLLDDSMVIVGLWPMRGQDGRLILRRRYQFEFASTGDERYSGNLILHGMALDEITLDTYKLPPEN